MQDNQIWNMSMHGLDRQPLINKPLSEDLTGQNT